MQIRRLSGEERYQAEQISTFAFHFREPDPAKREKNREEALRSTAEDWGAFHEDGTLMGHIIHHKYQVWLDGQLIPQGGIGAVSTLPEYRDSGAIRAIFGELLPSAYREGEILSALYPFNHGFYRKFGYETVCHQNVYSLTPAMLRSFPDTAEAIPWRAGNDLAPYLALYNRFAEGMNLSARRDEKMMAKQLKAKSVWDREYAYRLRVDGQDVAYLVWQDVYNNPGAILEITDIAWDGRTGLRAVLGFLSRFTADYGTVKLYLPTEIELMHLHPLPYEVQKSTSQSYMVRAVNAPALLALLRKPADASFVIRVQGDELIPANNGTWHVTGQQAEPTDQAPDLTVSIQALAQLAVGAVSLNEAALRDDVEIHRNQSVLQGVFTRKPILIQEHF